MRKRLIGSRDLSSVWILPLGGRTGFRTWATMGRRKIPPTHEALHLIQGLLMANKHPHPPSYMPMPPSRLKANLGTLRHPIKVARQASWLAMSHTLEGTERAVGNARYAANCKPHFLLRSEGFLKLLRFWGWVHL